MKTYRIRRQPDGTVTCVVVVHPEGATAGRTYPLAHVVYHSPSGFDVGYQGSGPADLALSILADYFGESPTAAELQQGRCRCWGVHQAFKRHAIATMDRMGSDLTSDSLATWLAEPLSPRDGWHLSCQLCGDEGDDLVALQEHAMVQHGVTWQDLQRATRTGPTLVETETGTGLDGPSLLRLEAYRWTLPDGREWLTASRSQRGGGVP